MTEMSQMRGNVAYTGYRGTWPNVRNDAGIVGASDWTNRYSIWPGGVSGGISGSGETTGHHITTAEPSRSVCKRKCESSEWTDRVTTAGQWLNNRSPLNTTIAGRGRVRKRHTLRRG